MVLSGRGFHRHRGEDVNDGAVFAWCCRISRWRANRLLPWRVAAASARAHPHMPRRRKSASPLRASGGSASPSAAIAQRLVLGGDGRWLRASTSPRRPSHRGRFFSTDCSLDRPRMHVEAELVAGSTSPARALGSARPARAASRESQDLAVKLVRTAWTALLGHQPRNAGLVEARLGLVVGRPRDAVLVGRVRHRGVLDRDAAQHLVLDLHGVARIEELALPELRIADLLGRRVQRALFEEGVGLARACGPCSGM